MKYFLIFFCILILLLTGYGLYVLKFPKTEAQPSQTPVVSVSPSATPVQTGCLSDSEKFEPKSGKLPADLTTVADFKKLAGIEKICFPKEMGKLFLNTDWNSLTTPGVNGRMASLGFGNLYEGSVFGWGKAYVVYATYDFAVGSEYDIFATKADYDALKKGTAQNLIENASAKGFYKNDYRNTYGNELIRREYVFPMEKYYVAVIYETEGNPDAAAAMNQGTYPDGDKDNIKLLDQMAGQIVFKK